MIQPRCWVCWFWRTEVEVVGRSTGKPRQDSVRTPRPVRSKIELAFAFAFAWELNFFASHFPHKNAFAFSVKRFA